jgi:hypothetical protein
MSVCSSLQAASVNIVDHGAIADGATVNTQSIQRAIDHAHKSGGGLVVVPSGEFLTGTLVLRNHVHLHLEPGALLKGSVDLADYPVMVPEIRSYTDNYTNKSLIYAENVTDVGITGNGIIDGMGAHANFQDKPYLERPYMIRMIGCRDILIRDVVLRDSPMWVQHYLACDDLVIDGITVDSRHANHNNDGIDIDACHNVRISNCLINSQDDAIVLKSTMDRKCRNVVVDNCVLTSHCNAFKLGTESNGGFENITFSNSVIHNTRLSGIALEIVDGGTMRNIIVSDIIMDSLHNPLFIRLGNRARPYADGAPIPGVGAVEGISIQNIRATNIGLYQQPGRSDSGSDPNWRFIPASISGLPQSRPSDITIKNVVFEFPGGFTGLILPEDVPLNEKSYPEFRCMGVLPASALYIRNVSGIVLDGIQIRLVEEDGRTPIFLDNAEDVLIDDVMVSGAEIDAGQVGIYRMDNHPLDD